MNDATTPQQQATSPHRTQLLDTKLEVVVIPVSDVDRSKRFYERLGWRVDAAQRVARDGAGTDRSRKLR